jgi:hypothetical protein
MTNGSANTFGMSVGVAGIEVGITPVDRTDIGGTEVGSLDGLAHWQPLNTHKNKKITAVIIASLWNFFNAFTIWIIYNYPLFKADRISAFTLGSASPPAARANACLASALSI